MAGKAAAPKTTEVEILAIEQGRISVAVVGTTPLICNRVTEKVKRELLMPKGKKTQSEKQASLKHEPLAEYRLSPYTLEDESAPTRLAALSSWFKLGMMTAALELPGTKKAQIGRLVRVEGDRLPLYGAPKMLMSVTRSADMNRTPDVRTRAILAKWAVLVDVTFAKPTLREKSVLNLFAAAGIFAGCGDWRTQKGSANYGSYRLASGDDPELAEIMAQGRAEQIAALNVPQFYDDETQELYEWYSSEVVERGFKIAK